MAVSDYKFYSRRIDEKLGAVTTTHSLYTEASDIANGMFIKLKDGHGNGVYLPITTSLNSFFASTLRLRGKNGQIYAAKTEYSPSYVAQEVESKAYLYNLKGQVDGKYYFLGSLPFTIQDANKPLLVTMRLTGNTETGGGWADQVYTKIGIHIDKTPYMILEYASYGKTGTVTYTNRLIADKQPYDLAVGAHTIGLCIWAKCTSKDWNSCYITKVGFTLESDGQ